MPRTRARAVRASGPSARGGPHRDEPVLAGATARRQACREHRALAALLRLLHAKRGFRRSCANLATPVASRGRRFPWRRCADLATPVATGASAPLGAGAACAAVLVAPAFGGTATALSKLLLLLAYSSVYTLAAEMYPTALRAGGLALARIGDGIGSFAASALLGCSSQFIVLTCTALLAGLISTGFPETKDMEMQ